MVMYTYMSQGCYAAVLTLALSSLTFKLTEVAALTE